MFRQIVLLVSILVFFARVSLPVFAQEDCYQAFGDETPLPTFGPTCAATQAPTATPTPTSVGKGGVTSTPSPTPKIPVSGNIGTTLAILFGGVVFVLLAVNFSIKPLS